MHNLSIPKNRRPGPSNGQISTAPILGGRAVTLGDWGDIWYADYRSQVQPSTYYGYQFTLQIIKKWLGDAFVADVLPIHINLFMSELMKSGYGMSQIQKNRTLLIYLSGVPPGAHVGQVIHHPDNLTSNCTASPNKHQKEE